VRRPGERDEEVFVKALALEEPTRRWTGGLALKAATYFHWPESFFPEVLHFK